MKTSIDCAENVLTLRVEGNLDAQTAPSLRPTIDEILNERPGLVVVDLSGLRMIDSSGVGAIVSLYKRLRGSGGDLRLGGLAGQPLAIFRVLKLDRVFNIA
jgi:anti-sigma B factor antagonist